MKKLFILLLCIVAVLTVVACNNEPAGNVEDEGSEEQSWEKGVLLVKPAEDCVWATDQPRKFQFTLFQEFYAGESIEFLVKLSDNVTQITPRMAGDTNTKWIGDVPISSLTKNSDGWYVVTIPAEKVTLGPKDSEPTPGDSWDFIGISVIISSEDTRPDTYVAIKDLKLNGVKVNFASSPDYVSTWSGAPNALSVTITQ